MGSAVTRLQEQRILLGSVIYPALVTAAANLNYYVAPHFCFRCQDCPVGHPKGAHKEARAIDVVLYHKATGAVCDAKTPEGEAVFAALHDVADALGAAARIPGDLGHFSVAAPGQVR
jgi:hypothetical protein